MTRAPACAVVTVASSPTAYQGCHDLIDLRAPDANDLAALRLGRRELAAAAKAGRLLRIDDDIVLPPNVAELAAAALGALPQPFTASAAREPRWQRPVVSRWRCSNTST